MTVAWTSLHLLAVEARILPWRQAFAIAGATCAAVVEARRAGLERPRPDPRATFVEDWDAEPRVTIVDVPRRAPPTDDDMMRVVVFSEYEYSSPEEMLGKPLSGSSDVFMIGAITYRFVTGRLPFADQAGPAGLITAQLKTVPRAADISGPVDALLGRCLARHWRDRYADVDELAGALVTVLTENR